VTVPNATTDPGFFDGRYMVEITEWNWGLHVGLSALDSAVTCLSSVWKYLDIWTVGDPKDQGRITAFSFSASIHPNLIEWAAPELEGR
jgi:hypothetical protein